jgi:hypothetical protein
MVRCTEPRTPFDAAKIGPSNAYAQHIFEGSGCIMMVQGHAGCTLWEIRDTGRGLYLLSRRQMRRTPEAEGSIPPKAGSKVPFRRQKCTFLGYTAGRRLSGAGLNPPSSGKIPEDLGYRTSCVTILIATWKLDRRYVFLYRGSHVPPYEFQAIENCQY